MDDLAAVAALNDPVRRELYRYVTSQGRPVGRNEAAEAAGVARPLAAFHLDKLVEAGLLEADFARLTEKKGPGSGRPAKIYRRAPGEHQVSVPPRDYRTLALVLAEVVDLLGGDEVAEKAAHRIGARLGAESAASGLADLLAGTRLRALRRRRDAAPAQLPLPRARPGAAAAGVLDEPVPLPGPSRRTR